MMPGEPIHDAGRTVKQKKLPHTKSETASFYNQFSSICVKLYLATFSSHFTIASITPMEIKHTIKKIAQQ